MRHLFGNEKLNNDGVSLVELIVSILILAVIFTPTMSALVTALRVNTGARNTSQAETVAANVMEDVNFYGYSGMKKAYESAQANPEEISALAYTKDPDDETTDLLTFVNNPANPATAEFLEGDGRYRVKITYNNVVSISDYEDEETEEGEHRTVIKSRNLNDTEFADITELNETSTILINPATAHTDFDNLATDHFELLHRAYPDRTSDLDWSQIRSRISKKLYISIIRDNTYGEPYYILDSSMIYTFDGDGLIGPGAEEWMLTGYCDNVSFDELETLYLLYSPITGTSVDATGNKYIDWTFGTECVEIDGIDLSLEPGQKIKVRIVGQAAADVEFRGTLNVLCDTSQFEITSQVKTSVDGVENDTRNLGNGRTESKDRIYAVRVEVFDATGDGTEALATLESTIMD